MRSRRGGAFNLAPLSLSVAYGEQLTWSHSRVRSNEAATRERSTTTRTSVPDIDGSEVIFKPVFGGIGSGEIAWTSGVNIYIKNLVTEELTVLTGHTDYVSSLSYSPDGTQLASGSWDGTIRVWDALTGEHLRTLTGQSDSVESVSYSPDGTRLASGGDSYEIHLWDVVTGQHIRTLTGHLGDVNTVLYSPDGTQLASGSWDNTIRLWDIATGRPIRTLTGHSSGVESLSYSPDGTQLASGSWDNTIRLWNVATGQHIRTLTGHGDWVLSLSYSPDGTQLVSGSCGEVTNSECTLGEIRLWDVATGRPIRTFAGHGDWVLSLSYSPDGTQFASGSCGEVTNSECTVGEILLWDVVTGREIRKLAGHSSVVDSLSYSPDGTELVSGSCVEVTDSECTVGDILVLDGATRQSQQQLQSSLTLSVSPDVVDEGEMTTITATLSEAVGVAVTVSLGIVLGSGNGIAGSTDLNTRLTNIVIPANTLSETTTLSTIEDTLLEGDETFGVYIEYITATGFESRLTNMTPLGSAVTVTILDDDAPILTLGVSSNTVLERGSVTITARLSLVVSSDVVVTLGATAGSTAEATDYTFPSITLAANETSATGTLEIMDDDIVEGSETIEVYIDDIDSTEVVLNGTPVSQAVTVTISDDDGMATVTLSQSVSGGMRTITATLDKVLDVAVVVTVTISDGTTLTTITIPANTLSEKSEGLEITDDIDVYIGGIEVASGSTLLSGLVSSGTPQNSPLTVTMAKLVTLSQSVSGGMRTITATLNNVLDMDVVVLLEALDGTSLPSITIPAGMPSGSTIGIEIIEDLEVYIGGIETASGSSIPASLLSSGTPQNSPLTVTMVKLVTLSQSVSGGFRTITATLNNVLDMDVVVLLEALDGTSLPSITIPAGILSGSTEGIEIIEDLEVYIGGIETAFGSSIPSALVSSGTPQNRPLTVTQPPQQPQPLNILTGHSDWVNSVAYSPNGRQLASGSDDNTILLWDVATGQPIRSLTGHTDAVESVAYSPNGRQLASGSGSSVFRVPEIRLWDVATGRPIGALIGHTSTVRSVSYSPDGTQLASGSDDETIRLWDVVTGLHRTLTGHSDYVRSVVFSPDGRQLASGSDDGTIRLWDVVTGLHRTLRGHSDGVTSVSYSPNGRQLASGSWDRTIRLWDVATGLHIRTLTGHSGWVFSVSYSPNGRQLASGSDDETIRLWDISDRDPLNWSNIQTLRGHRYRVSSVSYSPNGRQLASGSDDNTIRLWDVADGSGGGGGGSIDVYVLLLLGWMIGRRLFRSQRRV